MNNQIILSAQHLYKSYLQGKDEVPILEDINLELKKGEIIAITGASGSGKSTLLHLIGLLDNVDAGKINLDSLTEIQALTDQQKTLIRRKYLGFIYQYHYLLKDFTVIDNIILPQLLQKQSYKASFERAAYLLAELGLAERQASFPGELSGGEQQRVAIARALASTPVLLLADEPTGNLDHHNALNVLDILLKLARTEQMSAIVVTHSLALADKMDKVYEVCEGRLLRKEIS